MNALNESPSHMKPVLSHKKYNTSFNIMAINDSVGLNQSIKYGSGRNIENKKNSSSVIEVNVMQYKNGKAKVISNALSESKKSQNLSQKFSID